MRTPGSRAQVQNPASQSLPVLRGGSAHRRCWGDLARHHFFERRLGLWVMQISRAEELREDLKRLQVMQSIDAYRTKFLFDTSGAKKVMSRSQDPKIRSNQVMWKISVAGLNTFQQLYGGAATPEIQGLMLVVMNWWFDGFGDGNQSVAYCWRSETYNLSVSGKVGIKATTQEPHCGIEPIQWTLTMAVMLSVVNHIFLIFIPTWAEDPKLPDILRLKPPTSHETFHC